MKKLLFTLSALILLQGCTVQTNTNTTLPNKELPTSVLMSESPITTLNIDSYLFREDTYYVDTRSTQQFQQEGHIAGFVNIPFYGLLVDYSFKENVLFTMDKFFNDDNTLKTGLGDVGSFISNYEESEFYLTRLFPKDKNIIFMSTAGVEASYLMNLLIQYGYDASMLYNAGPFTNSMGLPAYSLMENPLHLVKEAYVYDKQVDFIWPTLTIIE